MRGACAGPRYLALACHAGKAGRPAALADRILLRRAGPFPPTQANGKYRLVYRYDLDETPHSLAITVLAFQRGAEIGVEQGTQALRLQYTVAYFFDYDARV